MIRSVDEEELQDICRGIALDNFGFLYVNDHKDQIQTEYGSADTGLTKAGSVSLSGMEETLQEVADGNMSPFKKLRNGVYYYDPFETREGSRVSDELKSIFTYDLVVNKETIESRFDIAPTDVDFFASELVAEDYIRRIAAGERDYYVSGPRLKDETAGDASVDSRLQEEAKRGILSHTELETVIDVAATNDIIRFLEKNDFIVDLDGEYLVKDSIEEYAAYLENEVGEAVIEEFDDIGVLPVSELDQILQNQIDRRFGILPSLDRSDTETLLKAVRKQLADNRGLDLEEELAIHPDRFKEYITRRATQIRDKVEDEYDLATPSDYREQGAPRIKDIEVSDVERVNQFTRERIESMFETLINRRFSTEET